MSNIHEQALEYVYTQVLEHLMEHMSQALRASMQLLIQRLMVAAGGVDYLGQFQLLVIHGADRDSALLLSTLRAAQLTIAQRAPQTFRLKVLVASLPAASEAALDYHERCFSTLFLQDDPRVELLMIQGHRLVPFSRRPQTQGADWMQSRDALLLFGHLNGGTPEALFGSRLHLQMASACNQVLSDAQGVLALITLVPPRQRYRYLAWCRRCLRLAGEPGLHPVSRDIAGMVKALAWLHDVVATPSHAALAPAETGEGAALRVIAVDDLLDQKPTDREFERLLKVPFEAPECLPPLAVCFEVDALTQVRQLRERIIDRRIKGANLRLGLKPRAEQTADEVVQARLMQVLELTEKQLICLLHAPFAGHGAGLASFIECYHPGMLVAMPYLHRALLGKPCPDGVLHWLVEASGLSLVQLRAVYGRQVGQPARRMLEYLARRDMALRLLRSGGELTTTDPECLPGSAVCMYNQ
nr:hypothetical protein [uncultured Pseudomonas sp.]